VTNTDSENDLFGTAVQMRGTDDVNIPSRNIAANMACTREAQGRSNVESVLSCCDEDYRRKIVV
jgi:hypothetical protein